MAATNSAAAVARSKEGDTHPRWQHPWLRIQLLLRSMLGTRWDLKTWATVKAEMKKALAMRNRLRREGWFN